jgi:hypothetical protein
MLCWRFEVGLGVARGYSQRCSRCWAEPSCGSDLGRLNEQAPAPKCEPNIAVSCMLHRWLWRWWCCAVPSNRCAPGMQRPAQPPAGEPWLRQCVDNGNAHLETVEHVQSDRQEVKGMQAEPRTCKELICDWYCLRVLAVCWRHSKQTDNQHTVVLAGSGVEARAT